MFVPNPWDCFSGVLACWGLAESIVELRCNSFEVYAKSFVIHSECAQPMRFASLSGFIALWGLAESIVEFRCKSFKVYSKSFVIHSVGT